MPRKLTLAALHCLLLALLAVAMVGSVVYIDPTDWSR
jgi:hypothetical protein